MSCRACDTGLVDWQCVRKNVAYYMCCAVHGEFYVVHAWRSVREIWCPWKANVITLTTEISAPQVFSHHSRTRKLLVSEASLPCIAKNSRSCSHYQPEASSEERKWMDAGVKTFLTRSTVNTVISPYIACFRNPQNRGFLSQ